MQALAGDGKLRNWQPVAETVWEERRRSVPRSVPILGCRVDRVNRKEALAAALRLCSEAGSHLLVTADSSMLVFAQRDDDLFRILADADLVVPDSIGVVLAGRLIGTPFSERVTGVDLMEHLCAHFSNTGQSVYFLGSAEGVAEKAAAKLVERYPGLIIAGVHHGYFEPADEPLILDTIRRLQPDALFVAMGIPRQEKWLRRNLDSLPVRLGMGIGGSLDVMAGEVRRAPAFFRRNHLEWLYRITTDVRRLRKGLTLPIFAALAVRYRLRHRRGPWLMRARRVL